MRINRFMMKIRTVRRERLGITQAELADLLGVDQAKISRIEKVEAGGGEADPRTILAVEALVARKSAGLPLSVSGAAA
jgi:predicted transcriptional regulator